MHALELLKSRTSSPALRAPAPTKEQLDEMFKAALRAPDHMELKPYRFVVIEGEGLDKLGELFLAASLKKDPDLDEAAQKKKRNMPLRAPMIVAVIAVTQKHPKVPGMEQIITAGCAANAIIQSAFAQGLGAMWRTGEMSHDETVREGLGVKGNEKIIGYLYLGRTLKVRAAPEADYSPLVSHWQ